MRRHITVVDQGSISHERPYLEVSAGAFVGNQLKGLIAIEIEHRARERRRRRSNCRVCHVVFMDLFKRES